MKAHNEYKKTTTKDRKCVKVHRVIVEKILGRELPTTVEVHHLDGDRGNNKHSNLVVCQDRSYHQLLHRRQEVIEAGFSPWTHHKCTDCLNFKEFSLFSKNKTRASGLNNLCKDCDSKRQKARYARID